REDALRLEQFFQFIRLLERPVVVARLVPGDVLRTGNVAAALRRFWHAGRRDDIAAEFLRASRVDEHAHVVLARLLYFDERRAQGQIRRLRLVGRRREVRLLIRELPALGEPFAAAAVHDA